MSRQYDYPVTVLPLSQADGGGFAAYVYDLPGCMSDGETAQEAYTNAQDAIECWIEGAQENGMPAPEPEQHLMQA
jgi:predicted RNase H-like HicB family nuclease